MYLNFKHELTMFLTYDVKKNFHLNEKIIYSYIKLRMTKITETFVSFNTYIYDMHLVYTYISHRNLLI